MGRFKRNPAFCICESKGADQLRSNCAADQRLCFRLIDSTILLLPKSNRKATNRNWSNQKANPAPKTKAGNKQTPQIDKTQ